ncbi:NUDIX domain-containing protein [Sphingomonas sp.]|uniref:NUDIX hydrolase n=1 Tax=Sphingomonas sp. TaxID=28214 RepID=UPI0018032415|nr:NUDIX domain-containing protein [Sphingomonas sp.]MBA3511437.1 NUDIX domain-containing protein [Sphingomonas sp.]
MSDEPIPAATLVLVRDRDRGPPELLMVERASGMAFAGGALVFPGGRIDDADRELAGRFGLADGGARVAAIRETLEETAVTVGIAPLPSCADTLALQRALVADRPFGELLGKSGLELDLESLTPLARWLPNFHVTRRFDTLFFIAAAPAGEWQPSVITTECSGAFWLTAAEALERECSGDARLIFPTRRNLERLAGHDSFAAMRADALAHPIDPITPWVEEHGGERFITIPGDLGYPVTREKLDDLWRG